MDRLKIRMERENLLVCKERIDSWSRRDFKQFEESYEEEEYTKYLSFNYYITSRLYWMFDACLEGVVENWNGENEEEDIDQVYAEVIFDGEVKEKITDYFKMKLKKNLIIK